LSQKLNLELLLRPALGEQSCFFGTLGKPSPIELTQQLESAIVVNRSHDLIGSYQQMKVNWHEHRVDGLMLKNSNNEILNWQVLKQRKLKIRRRKTN
jgi:hypothetical protein